MKTIRIAKQLAGLIIVGVLAFVTIPGAALARNADPDSAVRVSVMHRLSGEKLLTHNNIRVGVSDSVITLEGSVPTLYDVERASDIAGKAGDRYRVDNRLFLSAPPVSPDTLAAKVIRKVEDNNFYTVYDWLVVEVRGGVVTLHGWVREPWEVRQFAVEAAKVPGVREIVNRLKPEMGYSYLRYRVARLIYTNPFFQQYSMDLNPPIHIVVDDGTVILEGYVDSIGERGMLGSMVIFHTDAIKVINHLRVLSD